MFISLQKLEVVQALLFGELVAWKGKIWDDLGADSQVKNVRGRNSENILLRGKSGVLV